MSNDEEFSDYWFEVRENIYITPPEVLLIRKCYIRQHTSGNRWDLMAEMFTKRKDAVEEIYIVYGATDLPSLVLQQKMFLYKVTKFLKQATERGYL